MRYNQIKIAAFAYYWLDDLSILEAHRRLYLEAKREGKTIRIPRKKKIELMGRKQNRRP